MKTDQRQNHPKDKKTNTHQKIKQARKNKIQTQAIPLKCFALFTLISKQ